MLIKPRTFFAPDEPVAGTPAETEPVADPSAGEVGAGAGTPAEGTPPAPAGAAGTEAPPEGEHVAGEVVDWAARVQEWGGEDEVQEALKLNRALTTEEGVRLLFQETGRALGLGDEKIEALFQQHKAEAAEPEGPADDDLLTWKEARELLQKEVLEPQQKAQQEAAATALNSVISSTLESIGVSDDDVANTILKFADKHINESDHGDADKVRAAIRAGEADYQAFVQKEAQRYLAGKKETLETVPAPLGGATPGGEDEVEPQNMEEARARVRAQLKAGGAL